jgi:hypothetical protein
MPDSKFLCLAVARRSGGNCIAGIDIDSGKWIRPVNAKTHGAFADHETIVVVGPTQELKILAPLDILQIRLDRFVGNKVQPENWEMIPGPCSGAYETMRRFNAQLDAEILNSRLDKNGPLLYTYSDRIAADDALVKRGLRSSLSLIRPEELNWKIVTHPTYKNKRRVLADFRFDNEPYCLVVTDPDWEARCRRFGFGRHPHSAIAGSANEKPMLTISVAETPLNGYHYKLAAGVLFLPA